MAIRWNNEIDEKRIELIKKGYSYKVIAQILSSEFGVKVTTRAVESRCYSTNTQKRNLKNLNKKAKKNNNLSLMKNKVKLFKDNCYNNQDEFLMTPQKLEELNDLYLKLNAIKPKKILSLSDLHSPAIDFASVEKAILANQDADICLLNGDIYDGNSLSSFDKMSEIDIELEFKQIFDLLDVLTVKYKHVVWVGGNHDFRRFLTFVMKNFGPGMRKYVEQRLNPMDYIAEHYDNVIIVPHDWIQIGDIIFAHLSNYSSVDMKTVVNNYDIFNANRNILPNPDFRAIIIGHTHHAGKIVKNGTLLIEQGCLCHLQDYRFMKPVKNRWQLGYAIAEFDDNLNVDFNKTNVIFL